MNRKIIPAIICLSLAVACFPEIARGNEYALYDCYDELSQRFFSLEAIKEQFGDQAEWQERTEQSSHGDDIEIKIFVMLYPGVTIEALGFTYDNEDRFFLTALGVDRAGYVDFLGIDIGSSRENVIKTFGEPDGIEENRLHYDDEADFTSIEFIVEDNMVAGMRLFSQVD